MLVGSGGFDPNVSATSFAGGEPKGEGILPTVIQQVLKSPESDFNMFGFTYKVVVIVGIVRRAVTSTTKMTFTLEDHTGQIDGHFWLEHDAEDMPFLPLNRYALVFASIRHQSGQKTLMIYKIEALPSINDLTTHLLETLQARYQTERISIGGESCVVELGEPSSHSGMNANQCRVFEMIRSRTGEPGVSLQELQQECRNISPTELR